jgi:hypothetical protein
MAGLCLPYVVGSYSTYGEAQLTHITLDVVLLSEVVCEEDGSHSRRVLDVISGIGQDFLQTKSTPCTCDSIPEASDPQLHK